MKIRERFFSIHHDLIKYLWYIAKIYFSTLSGTIFSVFVFYFSSIKKMLWWFLTERIDHETRLLIKNSFVLGGFMKNFEIVWKLGGGIRFALNNCGFPFWWGWALSVSPYLAGAPRSDSNISPPKLGASVTFGHPGALMSSPHARASFHNSLRFQELKFILKFSWRNTCLIQTPINPKNTI